MTINFVSKEALVGASIEFTTDDNELPNKISLQLTHNFIEIISLNASGNPVMPTSGFYKIYVKTAPNGAYYSIKNNGTILARKTAGNLLSDGEGQASSFSANPYSIKIVPTGIIGANSYRVDIRQNLT